MKAIYIATVQVAIEAETQKQADDELVEGMNDMCLDWVEWSYLKIGGQFCRATVISREDDFLS